MKTHRISSSPMTMRTEALFGSFGENFHLALHHSDMNLVRSATHHVHSIRLQSHDAGINCT
jgi:hypothetical protein